MKTMEQEFNEKYETLNNENVNIKEQLIQEKAERRLVELSQFDLETKLIAKGIV